MVGWEIGEIEIPLSHEHAFTDIQTLQGTREDGERKEEGIRWEREEVGEEGGEEEDWDKGAWLAKFETPFGWY